MKKTNVQICSNCGAENPLHQKTCIECKHYLRARVFNIDLWKTAWKMFESPTEALTGVIHAEHKNFLLLLLILLALKIYSVGVIFQSAFNTIYPVSGYFFLNLLLQLIIYSGFIILFSLLLKIFLGLKRKIRFKDVLAVTVYSFSPLILAFIVLVPVQFGIFGVHWFTYNPSPFLIKYTFAYALAVLEGIMLLWGLFVFVKGLLLQSGSWILTIIFTILFLGLLSVIILFIPFVII